MAWTALWRGGAGSRTRAAALDIALDFLFYALVPFGFGLADPLNNAPAGGWLLFAFIGTGEQLSALPPWRPGQIANPGYAHKSLYYLGD